MHFADTQWVREVVHLDMKPWNVLMGDRKEIDQYSFWWPRPMLADFGSAIRTTYDKTEHDWEDNLTNQRGTRGFMAPVSNQVFVAAAKSQLHS